MKTRENIMNQARTGDRTWDLSHIVILYMCIHIFNIITQEV